MSESPDSTEGEPPPSLEDVRSALGDAGLEVEVEERMLALTASVDGGMLLGIFLTVQFSEFAKLMADDAYLGIKKLLRRFHRSGKTDYVVYATEGDVDARIDPDLPPEAYLRLQGRLPIAPSGRIVYNREVGQWQDSEHDESPRGT